MIFSHKFASSAVNIIISIHLTNNWPGLNMLCHAHKNSYEWPTTSINILHTLLLNLSVQTNEKRFPSFDKYMELQCSEVIFRQHAL